MTLNGHAVSSPASAPPVGWPQAISSFLNALPRRDRAEVLTRRLRALYPGLSQRLSALYAASASPQAHEAFVSQVILNALSHAASREDDLWRLDLSREAHPAWVHAALTGYCAYVDKFAGTLEGVKAQIPYLQELGVSYLHLLPFLKAGQGPNDGGFAVASFDEIEPALGTLQGLSQLCRALRAAGISLCSDFVLNHVSHDHAWAQAARRGDARYVSYFHWKQSASDVAAQEPHLVQIFPKTAPGNFTHIAERNAWVWTTFYPYQWDLNYANPAVFAEMAHAMLNLANHGVESFRLDSTAFLWKRAGTDCMNQPEVHLILQALRALTDLAAPAVMLKAEAIMPTQELPPYLGMGALAGPECHVAYHSSLMSASWVALAEQDPQVVAEVLANTPELPLGTAWLTYVRCHDDIGWNVLRPELTALGSDPLTRLGQASRLFAGLTPGSYAQGAVFQANDAHSVHGTNGMTAALTGLSGAQGAERTLALQRIRLLFSLSFFMGGLPLIYMGDELGMGNVSEAELRQRQGPDGRELHRPWMDTAAQAARHDASTSAGELFSLLRGLVRARREHLSQGHALQVRPVACEAPGVLVLHRHGQWGVFNFRPTPVAVPLGFLPAGAFASVLEGAQPVSPTLSLGAHGAAWLCPVA